MKRTTAYIPAAQPGTDLKFRVTTTKEDFSLARDEFNIVIKNRYGRVTHRITKNDCFYDSEARWYFTVPNIAEGGHYAVFVGAYEDDDYDEQKRMWSDRQPLFVGREGCMMTRRRAMHPQGCPVHYEQVWVVSIDGADYLADCNGEYIYTSDGKRIQFSNSLSNEIEDDMKIKMKMTGEEFLRQWEGRSENGKMDTVPELYDAMRGINDTKTVKEEIDDQVTEDQATHSDIDELFPDLDGGSGGFPDEMEEEYGD